MVWVRPFGGFASVVVCGVVMVAGCGRSPDATVSAERTGAAEVAAPAPVQAPVAANNGQGGRAALPAAPPNLDLSRSPQIPLVEGLVIVTAVAEERGDYEVVKRISLGEDRLQVAYSATLPILGEPTEVRGRRIVLTRDLKSARIYRVRWISGRTELARGTTALGVSAEVLQELRQDGRSECSLASIEEAGTLLGATGLPSPEFEGVLERVEKGPVPVPVLVDGERQWLPAMHAKGRFEGLTGDVDAEFWFLDNPDNPLTLRASIGTATLVVIRIDRPAATNASRIERALQEEERVDLPGVYFEFASAKLRPESDPAIAEVADLLKRHPDWKLRLEGHTDSVGGASPNLELSRLRAEAVRAAIVARLGVAAERLEAAGLGLTRPRDTNDTPEGRAQNRRVEIVKLR